MKIFTVIVMVAVISCGVSGCIDNTSDSTGTHTVNTGGSSGGSSSGSSSYARDCPNCGHYPQYKGKMCVVCGYGDNDGILYCPSCGAYRFFGTSWSNGYCKNCGYSR